MQGASASKSEPQVLTSNPLSGDTEAAEHQPMKLKGARTAVAGALVSAFAFTIRSEAASGMFAGHELSTNIDLVAVTAVTTCEGLQEVLQGEYVLDLAGFRETATTALQLLDENEGLRPYAAWLRT